MEPLEAAQYELIEAGGRTAQSFGINRLLGQMYMYLFLCPDPVCLDELSNALGVSKASASIAGRQLESWGVLRRIWIKGDRKDYYEAVTDLSSILNNGLMASINKKLGSASAQLERSLSLIKEARGDTEKIKFIRSRLEEAEKYRSRLEKLLNNPLVRKLL